MSRAYLLFRSTHETLKAEKSLQEAGLACKIVQRPNWIRSDCGLVVRIDEALQPEALAALAAIPLTPKGVHVK